jgi:Peptidase family M28/PA domain
MIQPGRPRGPSAGRAPEPWRLLRGIGVQMDRCRWLLGALLAALLVACGTDAPIQTSPPDSPDGASVAPLPAFAADTERIADHLAALQVIADEHGGHRFSGTGGYEASVDWAAEELAGLGFEVDTPEVEFTGFAEAAGTELVVGAAMFNGPDELRALIYSAGGEVTAPVEVLDESGCAADDFENVEPGTIVLTVEGGCLRRQQAINAVEAGAAALLVGYPGRGPGEIFRPTLIDPAGMHIPVVSVTDDAIRALESAGDEPARLSVATEREPTVLRNVVAQLGDGPTVVMVGAHLDSVLEGPGINDNGSGVASVLEIARGVAEAGVPDGTAVRIGLWGGEELGLVGSRAYVEDLADDELVAYLNLDMTGSPNGANLVYNEVAAAEESAEITQAFVDWFTDRGHRVEPADLGGGSDHGSFNEAGIPTGGLFAGASATGGASAPSASGEGREPADACYHLACDDINNVDVERAALFADATLAVALELIRD